MLLLEANVGGGGGVHRCKHLGTVNNSRVQSYVLDFTSGVHKMRLFYKIINPGQPLL